MSQVCFDSNAFYTVLIITSFIFIYTLTRPHQNVHIKQRKHEPVRKIIINRVFNDHHEQDRNFELQRFLNPMIPPLRRGPLNLRSARNYYRPFNQMGYLHNVDNHDQAMPLMGRRLHSQQYEYYTFHHNNPEIKIPIKIAGDKEILDSDVVNLENYQNAFKAKIYDLDTLKYVPY